MSLIALWLGVSVFNNKFLFLQTVVLEKNFLGGRWPKLKKVILSGFQLKRGKE